MPYGDLYTCPLCFTPRALSEDESAAWEEAAQWVEVLTNDPTDEEAIRELQLFFGRD